MTEHIILGFLMYRALSMYEIKKAMESSTQHFLSASFGSLHPTLQRLEREQLIHSSEDTSSARPKRIYEITPAGREHFLRWLRGNLASERTRDPSLLHLFFLGHLEPDDSRQLIDGYVRDVERRANELVALQELLRNREVPPEFERHREYQFATLQFGIDYCHFVRDWYTRRFLAPPTEP